MDYAQMTAPCGLPCFECIFFLANKSEEQRQQIVQELGLPYDQAICGGCRNVEGDCKHNPMPCRLYPCAKEKGVQFCFECTDFPCDFLHPYADQATTKGHNLKIFNLCLIIKMGLQDWAENKIKKVGEVYFTEKWTL